MKKIILSVLLSTSLFALSGINSSNTNVNIDTQYHKITPFDLPNQH